VLKVKVLENATDWNESESERLGERNVLIIVFHFYQVIQIIAIMYQF